MQGNEGHRKSINKHKVWAKHGRRKGGLVDIQRVLSSIRINRPTPEMFEAVKEAFDSSRK